ncbi:MAG: choice-of-anchor D domain-containing protein [Blastocatellia bacterium]
MNDTRVARRRRSALLCTAALIATVVLPVAGLAAPKSSVLTGSASAARATASNAADAVVADFNGDRQLDVVEASTGGGLSVRWGIRKGEYGEAATFASEISARRVVSADVTADGINDVVAYAPAGTVLWVVPGSASGGFGAVRATSVPDGIHAIAVGEFAGSGGTDIAVASEQTSAVVLLRNRDDRSGFDATATALPSRALSIGAVKFNLDNHADLVVGLENRSVVGLEAGGGGFAITVTRTLEFSPDLMTTADFDIDGWADAIVASKNGEIAAFARGGGSIGEPVVSKLSAPLTKIDAGFVDTDAEIDVVGSGSSIAMVFPGLGGGAFGAPRQVVKDQDVESVSVVASTGGRQSQLVVAKDSGVSVETIATPTNKLAATFTVTNCGDRTYDDDGMCTPNTATVLPEPVGSLRWAIGQANGSAGADTIVFNLSIAPGPDDKYGRYSAASLVFHILILGPLVLSDSGTTIVGETALDTNPFGPDVAVQPLNEQGFLAALLDEAPEPPVPLFDGFVITGSGCSISGLIIAGTNFGGFLPIPISQCTDPTTETDVDRVGEQFDIPVTCIGGGNVIVGNFIGTDQRGFGAEAPLPVGPGSGAVSLLGSGNRVGGDALADRNIIVSSTNGVTCLNASGNQIIGNIIGSDGTSGGRPGGTNPLRGVNLQNASGTVIRGNIIGASSFSGIQLTQNCASTTIASNRVGVNQAGTTTANTDGGIVINASSATLVSPANIISNNTGIDGVNSGGIVITGSAVPTVGTDIADNTIAQNGNNGVYIDNGNLNTIGPNNLISTNTLYGVGVANGTQNQITRNMITNNGGIGINLVSIGDPSTGITPNDATDADTGPNNLLNFPVFTASTATTTTVTVSGTAPANSLIEIFKSDSKQANGQGFEFMISTTSTGAGTFSVDLPLTLPLQDSLTLTATATDGASNTSEFGPNFKLNQRLNVSPLSITFPTTAVGGVATAPLTICNTGVSNLTISALVVAPAGGPFSVSELADDTLSPGECVTLTVTFAPTSASNFAGSITITSDDPSADDVVVTLGGTAVLGVINVNVTTLLIPQTRVDGSRSAIVTVSNPTSVAVTVTRTEFKRRNSAKVTFTDRIDPFFRAVPSTFTVPAGGSVDVSVIFSPLAPIPTTDTSVVFELPDPGYQTPKKVQTDMTFVVSDSLGISKTVAIKAKVKPVPGITGGGAPNFVDQLDLTLDVYDPDNNLSNARFFFLNESEIELFRIDNTPGVTKAIKKFAKGMNVPLTFTFTGLANYAGSLRFLDCVVDDGSGQSSNTVRFRIRYINPKSGPPQMVLVPESSSGVSGFRGVSPASIFLPPMVVGPSRR